MSERKKQYNNNIHKIVENIFLTILPLFYVMLFYTPTLHAYIFIFVFSAFHFPQYLYIYEEKQKHTKQPLQNIEFLRNALK